MNGNGQKGRTLEKRLKGYSLIAWIGGVGASSVIASAFGGWDVFLTFLIFWGLASACQPFKSNKRVHYLMGMVAWTAPWIIATISLAAWLTSLMDGLWPTSQAALMLVLFCQAPFIFLRIITIPEGVGFWGKER